MNNIKKYIIGFIIGLSCVIGISYASDTGYIGALFEKVGSDWKLLGGNIKDGTISQSKLDTNTSDKINRSLKNNEDGTLNGNLSVIGDIKATSISPGLAGGSSTVLNSPKYNGKDLCYDTGRPIDTAREYCSIKGYDGYVSYDGEAGDAADSEDCYYYDGNQWNLESINDGYDHMNSVTCSNGNNDIILNGNLNISEGAIKDGTITSSDIKDRTITSSDIKDRTITSSNINTYTISESNLTSSVNYHLAHYISADPGETKYDSGVSCRLSRYDTDISQNDCHMAFDKTSGDDRTNIRYKLWNTNNTPGTERKSCVWVCN